jgi:hypothetical protein
MATRAERKARTLGINPAAIMGETAMADEQTAVVAQVELGKKEFEVNREGKIEKVTIFEFAGKTKGKGSRDIKYWNFDMDKPDTLPRNAAELKTATKFINTSSQNPDGVEFENSKIVEFLIVGCNDFAYNKMADEIGEYLNDEWPDEIKQNFRIAVRNTSKMTGMSIEETATFLKAPVEKAFLAAKAAAANQPTA